MFDNVKIVVKWWLIIMMDQQSLINHLGLSKHDVPPKLVDSLLILLITVQLWTWRVCRYHHSWTKPYAIWKMHLPSASGNQFTWMCISGASGHQAMFRGMNFNQQPTNCHDEPLSQLWLGPSIPARNLPVVLVVPNRPVQLLITLPPVLP